MDVETEAQGTWKLAQVHKASKGHSCDSKAVPSPHQKPPAPTKVVDWKGQSARQCCRLTRKGKIINKESACIVDVFIRVGLMKLTYKYILLIIIAGSSQLGRFIKANGFV